MALTFVSVNNAAGQNAGATGTSTASITPTMPASTVDDWTRVFVVQCGTGVAGTTPTNWTALFKDTIVGTGAVSAGGGQRYMSCYYRDKDASWSTIPAFTLASASAPSHWIGVVAVNKTSGGMLWNTPTFTTPGSDFGTANTAHSDTTGSLTTHTDGFLIIGTVENDNVTMTTPGLTQTGATFASLTERCDGGTATGNDVAGKVHTASVTTGATGTLTFTGTLSAASQGGSIVIEQTESAPPLTETLTYDFTSVDTTKFNFGANATITSGQLVLPCTNDFASEIDSQPRNAVVTPAYNLTGSSFLIQSVQTPNIGNGTTQSFMVLARDSNLDGQYELSISWANGSIDCTQRVANVPTTTTVSTTDTWWRIRESGGTVFWDTSADSINWTNRRSVATPFAITALYIQIICLYSGTEPAPGTAKFDNLNLPATGMTGTIASTAKNAAAAFTGAQTQSGTMASTVSRATTAFTGVMQPSGTMATTLQQATTSLTGSQAAPTVTGTIATTLQQATTSLTGTQTQSGTVAASLLPVTTSLTGVMQPSGTVAATLQRAMASLTGTQTQSGTVAAILLPATTVWTGAMQPSGIIAVTLQRLTANLIGVMQPSGIISATLRMLTTSMTGSQPYSGIATVSLQPLSSQSFGGDFSGTIDAVFQSLIWIGSSAQTQQGTANITLQALTTSWTAQRIAKQFTRPSADVSNPGGWARV